MRNGVWSRNSRRFSMLLIGLVCVSSGVARAGDLYNCQTVAATKWGLAAAAAVPPVPTPGLGGVRPWSAASPGRALYKVDLTRFDADAVCNDGSPAVMYVRKAPPLTPDGMVNPNRHRWHMHVKGGGSCKDHESCAERWCGFGGSFLNQPGLMSSKGTPYQIEGTGILKDDPVNRFSHYNQALVFYCSSDTWLGDNDSASVLSLDPADEAVWGSALDAAGIEFRGARIIDAALSALEAPTGLSVKDINGDATVFKMPKLKKAQSFLFSGDSAGGSGLRQHLDRLHARVDAVNTVGGVAPGTGDAIVMGFLDAGGTPDYNNPMNNYAASPFPSYTDMISDNYDQITSFHGLATSALDDSCVAMNSSRECSDNRIVQKNHITTPLFQRVALEDSVKIKNFYNSGFISNRATFRLMSAADAATLEVPDVGTEIRPNMQIMGTACRTHVVWSNGRYYSERTVASALTLQNHVENFVADCEAGACGTMVDIDSSAVLPGANTANCN